jgi:phosphoesterase RecJ-like protein
MPLDWGPFVDLVRRHQRFLLTTHIRPDGDALGSMLAMAEILEGQGKAVRTVVASNMAPRYRFLDPDGRVEHFEAPGDPWRSADCILILDTGAWGQLGSFGPFMRSMPVTKAIIDHHMTQDDLGALRLVDTTAEATGRLVCEAADALETALSPTMARALFVAVALDTGWFRHSNTTAATFALASRLTEAGARPEILYEQLFEQNSLPRLKLMGLVLGRLQTAHNGRVAHTEIHRGDYEATGATPMDTEDLVNFPRSLTGVDVGLLFMEMPRGGIKVSFRSREGVDVAAVAQRFGGGGHRQAAGAVLPAPLDEARARVLDAVGAVLPAAG